MKAVTILHFVAGLISLSGFISAAINAYKIRLYAVNTFGKVIHEFDPWFNFRATQYLADNGWDNFFSWFDHRLVHLRQYGALDLDADRYLYVN